MYSENNAPDFIKSHLSASCSRVGSTSSNLIKELGLTIENMNMSSQIDISVEEMKDSVKELQDKLKCLPCLLNIPPKVAETKSSTDQYETSKEAILTSVPLVEVLPLVSFASLLIEVCGRIEGLVKEVEELGKLADFNSIDDENKLKQIQLEIKLTETGESTQR